MKKRYLFLIRWKIPCGPALEFPILHHGPHPFKGTSPTSWDSREAQLMPENPVGD